MIENVLQCLLKKEQKEQKRHNKIHVSEAERYLVLDRNNSEKTENNLEIQLFYYLPTTRIYFFFNSSGRIKYLNGKHMGAGP